MFNELMENFEDIFQPNSKEEWLKTIPEKWQELVIFSLDNLPEARVAEISPQNILIMLKEGKGSYFRSRALLKEYFEMKTEICATGAIHFTRFSYETGHKFIDINLDMDHQVVWING